MAQEHAPVLMPESYSDEAFQTDLAPTAEFLLNRHLEKVTDWLPHEFVPWSDGKDFTPAEIWTPSAEAPPPAVRSALYLNLLTEDNLPYYFHTIDRMFGQGAWGEWARRWTAEEGRHAIVIRDFLTTTRAIDLNKLEKARMAQVGRGQVPEPETAADGAVYVTMQELATRIAHFYTGKKLKTHGQKFEEGTLGRRIGEFGYTAMKRVSVDENYHYLFYNGVVIAGIERNPSEMVIAIDRQVSNGFEMPGTGVTDYHLHAGRIAVAEIYNQKIYLEEVLKPSVIRHWKVDKLEGLTPEAEQSVERIMGVVTDIEEAVRIREERRQEKASKAASTDSLEEAS